MVALACLAASLALAAPGAPSARVERLVASVEPSRLHATVAALVGFGTRHTLSETASPTRGIGAARRWLAGQFRALAAEPGSRLQPFEDAFVADPGPRVPRRTEVVNVGAVLPGTDSARSREAVVVTAHYDSRASDVLDATSDAPGAVDDGSGTAVVLELARVLARERPAVAVYLVAVAGEEQGLLGSAHLAKRLASGGTRILAMTSIDILGNTRGQDGVEDDVTARLFSEASRRPRLRRSAGCARRSAPRTTARRGSGRAT